MSQKPHHYHPSIRTEIDASHCIMKHSNANIGTVLIETEIAPQELSHISLGEFPSGYTASFYIKNDNNLKDIEYWLTQLKSEASNEFVLHVFNGSDKATCVEAGIVVR